MTSTLISNFAQTVTVTRYAAGSFSTTTHKYAAGGTSTFNCNMSVQPLTDKEIENFASGQRSKRWLKGYTDTQIYTAEVADSKKADRITIDGIVYEVRAVQTWVGDLPHYKVVMAQMGEQ